RLRLEVEFAAAEEIGVIGFLAVDVARQPQPRAHVLTPAIKVKVFLRCIGCSMSAIEADDVEILVFPPDSSEEFSISGSAFRLNVVHEAPHIAQELFPRRPEI